MSIFLKIILLFVVLLTFTVNIAYAEIWSTKVIGIKDGDTISILHEWKEETIRLDAIDCHGNKYLEAKKFAFELVFGKW